MLVLAAVVSNVALAQSGLPEVDSDDASILLQFAKLSAQVDAIDGRVRALEAIQTPPRASTDVPAKGCSNPLCQCGAGCKCDNCQCGQPIPPQAPPMRRFTYRPQMTWPGYGEFDQFNKLRAHLQTNYHSQAANVWQMSDADVCMLHDSLHGKNVNDAITYLDGGPQPVRSMVMEPIRRVIQAPMQSNCPGGNCNIDGGQPMLNSCPNGNCNTGKRGRFGIIW